MSDSGSFPDPEIDAPGHDAIMTLAVFAEGGLAPASLLLGWLLGHAPLKRFAWDFHAAATGALLLWDSAMTLIEAEHATVGTVRIFGRDIWLDIRAGRRRMQAQARRITPTEEDQAPRHKCYVCGRNSNDEPRLDFRYCSKCAGDQCYCPDHIHNHVHVLTTDEPPKS